MSSEMPGLRRRPLSKVMNGVLVGSFDDGDEDWSGYDYGFGVVGIEGWMRSRKICELDWKIWE